MTEDLAVKFNALQSALFKDMEEALRRRELASIATLLKQGAHVNQTDYGRNTPLIVAAIKGDVALARLAISRNADLERANQNGDTALMLAVMNRQADVVRALIDAGADIHKVNTAYIYGRRTAINYAEERGHEEILQMLNEAVGNSKRAATAKTQHDIVVIKQRAMKEMARRRKVEIGPAP